MPEITVKFEDQVLQTFEFDGDLVRIGRSRENDIVLENLSVSRQHAQIRRHEDGYTLTDLNSANGTLLNGLKITKAEMVDEDVVTVGKHRLFFSNPVSEDVAASGDKFAAARSDHRTVSKLVVESGRLKGREFQVTRFETSLGKAATNDVVLTDDWLLSKKQAILLRKGNNSYEIQDLGGLRRVKVNGKAISDRMDIKDGDLMELGSTKMRFHVGDDVQKPGRKARPGSKSGVVEKVPELSVADMVGVGEPVGAARFGEHDSLDFPDDGMQSVTLSKAEPPPLPEVPVIDLPVDEPAVEEKAVSAEPVGSSPVKNLANRGVFDNKRGQGKPKKSRGTKSSSDMKAAGGTSDAGKPTSSQEAELTGDDKEIAIWKEALKSPSPAIRRQAARMLKQLTGQDYDA